jgi:hypothetical protein
MQTELSLKQTHYLNTLLFLIFSLARPALQQKPTELNPKPQTNPLANPALVLLLLLEGGFHSLGLLLGR